MERLASAPPRNQIPVNPLIGKLLSVDKGDDTTATYGGVYTKCLFFLAMTMLGVLLAVYFGTGGAIHVDPVTNELTVDKLVVWLLLIGAGMFFLFPFLAFLLRVTIPVTGSLYCVSVGFLFGFFAVLDDELGSYIILAFALTLAVVASMGFLFSRGIIRVTARTRAVTTTLFAAMVGGSLLLFLCSFVPFLRDCIMQLVENPILSALASVGGLVIAIMFLLVDFDSVRNIVEGQLPKKYEWYAAFGLVFTVVWVYLKILHLILQAKKN